MAQKATKQRLVADSLVPLRLQYTTGEKLNINQDQYLGMAELGLSAPAQFSSTERQAFLSWCN